MNQITYRILLITILIIGLSQTSYGQDMGAIIPEDHTAPPRLNLEDDSNVPLYSEKDPFFMDEPDFPERNPEEFDEYGSEDSGTSNPMEQANAINCRNNAAGLSMSRAQSLFQELDVLKRNLLRLPIEERNTDLLIYFEELSRAQRLLSVRCSGVELTAPDSLSLNFEIPSSEVDEDSDGSIGTFNNRALEPNDDDLDTFPREPTEDDLLPKDPERDLYEQRNIEQTYPSTVEA